MEKSAAIVTVLGLILFTAGCDILDPSLYCAMEALVTDTDGQPVAKVAVVISDADQVNRNGETNAAVRWVRQDLRKGHYSGEADGPRA